MNRYVDLTEYEDTQAAEIKAIQEKANGDINAAKTEEEVKAIEKAVGPRSVTPDSKPSRSSPPQ